MLATTLVMLDEWVGLDPGDPARCDDNNPCTIDFCDAAGCASRLDPSRPGCGGLGCTTDAACDDGQPCTRDRCLGGVCSAESIAGCCTSGLAPSLPSRCHLPKMAVA